MYRLILRLLAAGAAPGLITGGGIRGSLPAAFCGAVALAGVAYLRRAAR
jgi:hypothetical protein